MQAHSLNRDSSVVRIVAAALGLCAVAFLAGVAGDLSSAAPPSHGESVRVRIPNAVYAHPLAPLAAAERPHVTRVVHRVRHRRAPVELVYAAREKPQHIRIKAEPKPDPLEALKGERRETWVEVTHAPVS